MAWNRKRGEVFDTELAKHIPVHRRAHEEGPIYLLPLEVERFFLPNAFAGTKVEAFLI